MDELIKVVTKQISDNNIKRRNIEKDGLSTKTTIKAKLKPLIEELNALRMKLIEYQQVRDAKIPDHEKLPKDCIFYKHFLQVDVNSRIERAAQEQIKEDKELLAGIADGLSPKKAV